jgi:hypothetical protein
MGLTSVRSCPGVQAHDANMTKKGFPHIASWPEGLTTNTTFSRQPSKSWLGVLRRWRFVRISWSCIKVPLDRNALHSHQRSVDGSEDCSYVKTWPRGILGKPCRPSYNLYTDVQSHDGYSMFVYVPRVNEFPYLFQDWQRSTG